MFRVIGIFNSSVRDRIVNEKSKSCSNFIEPIKSIFFVSIAFFILPYLETEFKCIFRKCQIADGNFVNFFLHWQYIEVLQQSGYRRKADILDHFVAHARSPAAPKRQEMFWFQQFTTLHESLWHELFRRNPQLLRHI